MNIKHYIRVKCRIKVNNKILAMRRSFVCLLVGMFSYVTSYGADNLRVPDVRSIGMGGNVGTRSASFNPALLALEEEKSIRLNYFNKYLLKELGTLSGSFYYPNSFLSLGFDISAFGYEAYREMMFRFSMGKRLGNRWALGVGFHYSFLQTEVLESTKARLSVDLGLTYSPFDKLLIGVFMINMPSISLGDKTIDIEDFSYYLTQISFQWEIINNLLIVGSAGTDSERIWIGNIGLEYTLFDAFFFRAGMRTDPLSPSLGVGYLFSAFAIDAATIYHPVLGMSVGVGLSFTF